MANIPILAMVFGLALTIQIYIAKAKEKQGIEVFYIIMITGITVMQYFKDFSSEEFTKESMNLRS